MQSRKPDLVVHPTLLHEFQHPQHGLGALYNICGGDELTLVESPPCVFIADSRHALCVNLLLDPHSYPRRNRASSGMSADLTSYELLEPTPMYGVRETAPRYVVWLRNEPLSVCATRLDRLVSIDETPQAVARARAWAYELSRDDRSLLVFDLDGTLIDSEGRALRGAEEAMQHARDSFDYVVLWSHGSSLHVDEHATKLRERYAEYRGSAADPFDLVLSQPTERCDFRCSCKNLLHLYNYLPRDFCFDHRRCVLVDDSPGNWTPEYSRLVVPGCRNLAMFADSLLL